MNTLDSEGRVCLDGTEHVYRLSRVARRKRIHLQVDEMGTLVVRGPYHCTHRDAQAIILANRAWALKALERVEKEHHSPPPLEDGRPLPYLDGEFRLRLTEGNPSRVDLRADELWVQATRLDEKDISAQLETWYRNRAREHFAERLSRYAPGLDVRVQRLTVRDQKTRWGSCSSRGTISLNWRLLMVPSDLADYVVVHELCHLRHMNHSPRFWETVQGVLPRWRESRARLRAIRPSDLRF